MLLINALILVMMIPKESNPRTITNDATLTSSRFVACTSPNLFNIAQMSKQLWNSLFYDKHFTYVIICLKIHGITHFQGPWSRPPLCLNHVFKVIHHGYDICWNCINFEMFLLHSPYGTKCDSWPVQWCSIVIHIWDSCHIGRNCKKNSIY